MRIRPLQEIENDYLVRALRACDGNIWQTAARLGIGRSTLYRKLKAMLKTRGTAERAIIVAALGLTRQRKLRRAA